MDHRPITFEHIFKSDDALYGGNPAHLSCLLQPYNKLAPKPHLRSAPLLEEEQKGLPQDPAYEDPSSNSI